jgi:hypothetical protein
MLLAEAAIALAASDKSAALSSIASMMLSVSIAVPSDGGVGDNDILAKPDLRTDRSE